MLREGIAIMASTQLNQLLKILSAAGIFISLVLAAGFFIFAISGLQSEDAWAVMWNAFFIGLPLYGILFATLKAREYLRDILAALEKSQPNASPVSSFAAPKS